MTTPNPEDAALPRRPQRLVELFVRKRMFSLYIEGREIMLDQRQFAILLNLLRNVGPLSREWLAEAVYSVLQDGDVALRLRQDMERLKEQLRAALGQEVVIEDERGYALSEAVSIKVRAL